MIVSLIAHIIGQSPIISFHNRTLLIFPELLTLIGLAVSLVSRRKQMAQTYRSLPEGFKYAGLLLIVGGAISVAVSGDLISAFAAYKAWILLPLLAFFLLISTKRGGLYARIILYAVTAAQLLYGLLWAQGHSIDNRLTGSFSSPNYLSMLLGPVLVLLVLDAVRSKQKTGWLLAIAAVGIGLLATKSIGGLVGLGGALLYLLFQLPLSRQVRIIMGSLLVGIGIIASLLLISRLQSGHANSIASRLEIWHTALVLGSQRPLAGIGFGNFPQQYVDTVVSAIHKIPIEWDVPLPHNLYLAVWLYTGVLGLGGLCMLIREAWQRKYGLVFVPFLTLCIHGLFDTPYFFTPIVYVFWLLLAIGMADAWQNRQITFSESSRRSTR